MNVVQKFLDNMRMYMQNQDGNNTYYEAPDVGRYTDELHGSDLAWQTWLKNMDTGYGSDSSWSEVRNAEPLRDRFNDFLDRYENESDFQKRKDMLFSKEGVEFQDAPVVWNYYKHLYNEARLDNDNGEDTHVESTKRARKWFNSEFDKYSHKA